ncbi:MAG: barstar family protein [Zoogloeaceae bacterium]|nr:barstar family protein [Zoogloeaceae bacterium]
MMKLADPPANFHAPHAAGVFHIPASRVGDFADAAASGCGSVWRIDMHGARSKAELLARIATALGFPGWFGHNWDALSDSLSDLGWLPASTARVFILEGCSGREEALPILLEIFEQAVADWAERDIALWIFIAQEAGQTA